MPIPATCPACGARHRLVDSERGRPFRCLSCRAPFLVPDPADEPLTVVAAGDSARAARPGEGLWVGRPDVPSVRRRGVPPLAWAVGVVGLLLLGVVAVWGVAGYLLASRANRAAQDARAQPPVKAEVGPPARAERFPRRPGGLDEALAQLRDHEPSQRQAAAAWIERQSVDARRRAEVARALEPLLDDVHHGPRLAAVRALDRWGGRDNVPALARLLESDPAGFEGDECRRRATDLIVRLRDARGAAAIARNFKHPFEREQTRRALEALGPGAEEAVWPYLNDRDWGVRVEACRALKRIGTRRSLPHLEETLEGTRTMYGGSLSVADGAREAIDAIKSRS